MIQQIAEFTTNQGRVSYGQLRQAGFSKADIAQAIAQGAIRYDVNSYLVLGKGRPVYIYGVSPNPNAGR